MNTVSLHSNREKNIHTNSLFHSFWKKQIKTNNKHNSLPSPPQKKSSFQQNHNIWTAPLKKPTQQTNKPTNFAAGTGGLKVATTPIVFSTTPGWDIIIIITGMWSTAPMFLADLVTEHHPRTLTVCDVVNNWLVVEQPSWKNISQIGSSSPNRDENKRYLKPPSK